MGLALLSRLVTTGKKEIHNIVMFEVELDEDDDLPYVHIHLSVSTGPGTSAVVTTGSSVATSQPGPSAFLFHGGLTMGDLDVNCLGAPENKIKIILQFVVLYLCKQNNT